jgi:hypothetical protein
VLQLIEAAETKAKEEMRTRIGKLK